MKLAFFSALLWALAETGGSIWCRKCTTPACLNSISRRCDANQLCVTASIQESSVGIKGLRIYKDCADHTLCPTTGSQNFSVNLGGLRIATSVKCCDTDECNEETLPVPAVLPVNNLQCPGCHPSTAKCSCVVHCRGDETICFNKTAGNSSIGGCGSPGLCENAQRLNKLPFFNYMSEGLGSPYCLKATTKVAPNPLPLHCETCADPSDPLCKDLKTTVCPDGTMCVTSTTTDTSPGKPPIRIFKGCTPTSKCSAAGSKMYSLNIGISQIHTSLMCCNKDKCNSKTLTVPVSGAPGKMHCQFCIPGTKFCSLVVRCTGKENKCFKAKVTTKSGTFPILGCATANVCELAKKHHELPHMGDSNSTVSEAYCCDTNLCNTHEPVTMATTPTTTTTTPTTITTTTTTPMTTTTTKPTTTTPMTTTTTKPNPVSTAPAPTTGGGRKCFQCQDPSDPNCANVGPVSCPLGTMCVTTSIGDTSVGRPDRFYKGCAPLHKCPAAGFRFYSVNLGTSQITVFSKCCDRDYCNADMLPVLPPQPQNNLLCHFCSPGTHKCSLVVRCRGDEDKCFSAKVTNKSGTLPILGCTTANVCELAKKHHELPHMGDSNSTVSEAYCCDTNLCNTHEPVTMATTPTMPITAPVTESSTAPPTEPFTRNALTTNCPAVLPCPTRPPCPVTPSAPPKELLTQLQSLVKQLQELLGHLQNLLQNLQSLFQNILGKFQSQSVLMQLRNIMGQLQIFVERFKIQLSQLEQLLAKLQKPGLKCRCW